MTRHGYGQWTARALMAAILAAGAPHAAAWAQSKAVTASPKPGAAIGTVKVGATSVTLAHAYVAGPTDGIYIVELTDQPIPDEALAGELKRGGGQGQLRSGKAQGLLLYVSEQGFVQTAIPFVGEVRGEKMLASVGSLDSFTVTAGQATGAGSIAADKASQGWSYEARFAAAVRPIK